MSHIEQQLLKAGATLLRNSKHKIYELRGRRFTVSHSNKSNDRRDRSKQMSHLIHKLEGK